MHRSPPPSRLAGAFLAVLACAGVATAQSQQQCFSDHVALQSTNWSSSVSIPKFDPALGTLQQIDFTLTGHAVGSARAESMDAAPSTVTMTFQNMLTLTRPDLSVIVVTIPQAQFMDALAAFDGAVDFAGASGIDHTNVTASASDTVTAPPPASDLLLFTGSGSIVLPVSALGTSTATGAGNLLSQFTSHASADVQVCYTYLPNTPPVFTAPLCGATLMASAGVPMSFQVCASDTDPNDAVTLSASALPAGATTVPPLPQSGNAVCVTVSWTPDSIQVGPNVFAFVATDGHGRQAQCSVTVLVAECHLLLARGPGNAPIALFGHLYDTHLHAIRRTFPVTLDDLPDLALPHGSVIYAQVVMYNPLVFPTNPSQWSKAVRVVVNPDDTLALDWSGTRNGISIRPVPVLVNGSTHVRFQFAIDGL